MFLQHLFLAGFWTAYCVLHSVLASIKVKKKAQKNFGRWHRYYRLFYTVFAALSLAAVVLYQFSIHSPTLYKRSTGSDIVGATLCGIGLVLMTHCIKKYFLSLSGLKSLFQEAPGAELMINGIHRFVRHPLYTGTFLAIWGLWVVAPSLGLLIADSVITLYTLLAIRLEEEKLVSEFGQQYRLYQLQVPKLIPRLSLGEKF